MLESYSGRSRDYLQSVSPLYTGKNIMTMSVFRNMVIGLFSLTLMGNVVSAVDNVDDLSSIRKFVEAKDYQEAVNRLDDYLDKNPGDAQGRFLKGIVFSDQKEFDKAIEVFVSLTEDYPQLPEPYNNLAVLYAGEGKYLKARDALLVAIKTHPSYATAHENLGDIYAKMASEAYKKALEFDEGSASAKNKLAMIRDLFPKRSMNTAANPVANEETDQVVGGVGAESEDSIASPSSSPGEPLSSGQELSSVESIEADVIATIEKWAKAWSDKRLEDYLEFYAPTFLPADGRSLASWKALRRNRLSSPTFISVRISRPRVIISGNDKARIRFTQKYRSNTYQDTVRKVIGMIRIDGNWRFIREEVN
uniref:Tetratricopeptide repeat-containing protein n=1 Tax=Candidatus Kentrum sp. TC TaxID=2126339 RepID=A0A450YUB7_9GAMM|nr:MAG: Tetratricopeptide repeat-containing protein [Candidatus Kentron sp. TC]VFK45160.1 MAG: Tetratricopeptide repeat-containing protein [Candidatus Kentron sp. TC]VFK58318.1 MAG: Tetratricopeptide repeat-containing protein [Candidatus Kentron sp. TC]